MTSKRIQLSCTAAIALASLLTASGSDARVHPRSKARATVKVTRNVSAFHGNTTIKPGSEVAVATGHGELINLSQPISDVFTSNAAIVDVHVRSASQIYLFGKSHGNASVYATNAAGQIVYSANVQVDQNIDSIEQMLQTAMPDAQISVTRISGGIIVLGGTVINPEDAVQATALVNAYIGNDPKSTGGKVDVMVLNRIKTATPQQVNLQVRISEVSHSFAKNIGVNLNQFGPGHGGSVILSGSSGGAKTTLNLAGNIFGGNISAALDLAETNGDAVSLAQPNLTALSGETASFLAGGEIPIPIAQASGSGTSTTIEYKQYGVSLSFTPVVLADGRISMRVRPEVSSLDSSAGVTVGGFSVPGLKTRRSETTVELGSGQSMAISGLLSNSSDNSFTRTPGAGDVPVLGALFRSNAYKRGETELMIVVTPYLVKPVNANQIVMPTDGYKAPTDAERILLGKGRGGTVGGERPKPHMEAPATKAVPSLGALEVEAPVATTMPAPAGSALVGQVQVTPVSPSQPTPNAPKFKQANAESVAPGFGS